MEPGQLRSQTLSEYLRELDEMVEVVQQFLGRVWEYLNLHREKEEVLDKICVKFWKSLVGEIGNGRPVAV
jgi:hypothetical protein